MTTSADPAAPAAPSPTHDQGVLHDIARRVQWLSAAIVDAANAGRPNASGVKVGGHQTSSASMVDIMSVVDELFPLTIPRRWSPCSTVILIRSPSWPAYGVTVSVAWA